MAVNNSINAAQTGIVCNNGSGSFLGRTLTAGSAAITVTNGSGVSGNPTVDVTNPAFAWVDVTGTSQAMAVGMGYIADNAGLVTLTLPAVAAQFSRIAVVGNGAGGWLVAQNASQVINLSSTPTTTGVAGSLASINRYDCLELICVIANTTWVVRSLVGNLTVT